MVTRSNGLSLLEILVVLALAGLASVTLFAHRGGGASRRAAVAVQTFTLAARIEAIRRDRPVAVVYHPDHRTFEQRIGDDDGPFGDPCAGAPLQRLDLARSGRVSVLRRLRDDLVWLPTGVGRTCSGSGVISGTLELGVGTSEQRLVISSAGRIRREALP